MSRIRGMLAIAACLSSCGPAQVNTRAFITSEMQAAGKCLAAVSIRDKWAKRHSSQYQDFGLPLPSITLISRSFEYVTSRCQAAAAELATLQLPTLGSEKVDRKLAEAQEQCRQGLAVAIEASSVAADYADKLINNRVGGEKYIAANDRLLGAPFDQVGACSRGSIGAVQAADKEAPSSKELMANFDAEIARQTTEFEGEIGKTP